MNSTFKSDFGGATGIRWFMSRKAKILIVEDEAPVALVIRFLLNRAGCETEIAASVPKALQLAEENDFDLITLDVGMPSGNGFTLCEQLKQNPRLKETPIIFISGRASLEDQQHGLEMGAIDYIIKPFDSFEFAPRLLSHIKSPRPLNVSDQVADPNAESFGNSPQRNQ